MTHDSTWLGRTRAGRQMASAARQTRWTAPLGLLLACILLAGFASSASASTYDMRGEWSIELTGNKAGTPPLPGTDLIDRMEASGEYFGNASFFGGLLTASISGKVSNDEASFTVDAPDAPGGGITFVVPTATIETLKNEFTGPGTYYNSKDEAYETGSVKAKRLRDYQEIKEQEEREQREREEKAARENVRGEWALTLTVGGEVNHGVATILQPANLKNQFSSSSALFESVVGATFSGTLKGATADVTVTTEAYGQIPPSTFTSETMTVTSGINSLSMTGTGKFVVGPEEVPAEFTATRLHSYAEMVIREREEKEAKEAKEAQEAMQAKEAEEAAAAKRAAEAKKQAEEAAAKLAREAKEKLEKEAASKIISPPAPAALVAVAPSAKTLTLGGSGSLALTLTNPNAYAVQGHMTLSAPGASTGKSSGAKGKAKKKTTVSFGSATFAIAANGQETVKIKLSSAARAELTHHKTLSVTVAVATSASGMTSVSKLYTVVLHASSPGHHKG